jgi:hypothetical protein
MKEFVLVEFLFNDAEFVTELGKLHDLGEDFEYITRFNEPTDDPRSDTQYIRITAKINSQTATMIKLQNPTLAGKMRISYISDELKNKYRK